MAEDPRVRTAMMQVRDEFDKPGVKRLAVIISEDYRTWPKKVHLPGTNHDNEAMTRAFRCQDHFGVVSIQNNTTTKVIEQIVPFVVNHTSTGSDLDCIAIVFAGHGGEGQNIFSNEGYPVNFEEAFINPLRSLRKEVYKIVLIDACRGGNTLDDRGNQGEGAGYNLDRVLLDKMIIAYSTMPHHVAHETPTGSLWMKKIAQELEISFEGIHDIVMKANAAMNLEGEQQRPAYRTSDCNIRLKGKPLIVKEGVLDKKKEWRKGKWPMRWCELTPDGSFQCYNQQHRQGRLLMNDFKIEADVKITKHDIERRHSFRRRSMAPEIEYYAFEISLRHFVDIVTRWFGAKTETERQSWIDAFNRVSKKQQRTEAIPGTERAMLGIKTMDDFESLPLDKGAFRKKVMYKDKTTGEIIAIKKVDKNLIEEDDYFLAKNNVLQMTNHPFLVSFRYSFQTNEHLCFVMEFVHGNDLSTYLKYLSEREICYYGAEITLAIEFLHDLGIIYGDLKLESLLLDIDGHIKLKTCKEGVIFTTKYPKYLAPEVLEHAYESYDRSVDWWGLGVVMHKMMCKKIPSCAEELKIPAHLSENAKALLSCLLQRDPIKRLGGGETDAEEVKKHPFFEHISWQELYDKKLPVPFKPEVE